MHNYTIVTKNYRQKIIKEIILNNEIPSQDMLLNILINKGFALTQATLSRDIKELKIIKAPTSKGVYIYQLSDKIPALQDDTNTISSYGFVNIGFSGQLAVVKTRPGYAMGIASEIDQKLPHLVLGTVAGDDTILIIPKEGIEREKILESLSEFIPI